MDDHWMPWVGPDYPARRLLLLGESFYLLEDGDGAYVPPAKDQPVRLVREAYESDEFRYRFNRMIVRALSGREDLLEDDWRSAWTDVAFTNYVNAHVDGRARARPEKEAWESSAAAWPSLLDRLLPKAIVVLGRTLWDNMPYDGYNANDESYRLPDGSRAFCIPVRHPAAGLSWYELADAIRAVETRAVVAR